MNVTELLEKVKTKLHEEFGPEVGRVATKVIDDAKNDVTEDAQAVETGINDLPDSSLVGPSGENPPA